MKKFLSLFMLICLLLSNTFCFALTNAINTKGSAISPRYIAIMEPALNLEKLNKNKVRCWAENIVEYGKISKVKVELQMKDGIWETIKTWEDTYENYVCIEKEWYVESSYKYRMKVTFEAYTENMVFIERSIRYSAEI